MSVSVSRSKTATSYDSTQVIVEVGEFPSIENEVQRQDTGNLTIVVPANNTDADKIIAESVATKLPAVVVHDQTNSLQQSSYSAKPNPLTNKDVVDLERKVLIQK